MYIYSFSSKYLRAKTLKCFFYFQCCILLNRVCAHQDITDRPVLSLGFYFLLLRVVSLFKFDYYINGFCCYSRVILAFLCEKQLKGYFQA